MPGGYSRGARTPAPAVKPVAAATLYGTSRAKGLSSLPMVLAGAAFYIGGPLK